MSHFENKKIVEKKIGRNWLKSLTGFFIIFSEMSQGATFG